MHHPGRRTCVPFSFTNSSACRRWRRGPLVLCEPQLCHSMEHSGCNSAMYVCLPACIFGAICVGRAFCPTLCLTVVELRFKTTHKLKNSFVDPTGSHILVTAVGSGGPVVMYAHKDKAEAKELTKLKASETRRSVWLIVPSGCCLSHPSRMSRSHLWPGIRITCSQTPRVPS